MCLSCLCGKISSGEGTGTDGDDLKDREIPLSRSSFGKGQFLACPAFLLFPAFHSSLRFGLDLKKKNTHTQLGILLADLLVECGIHCFHLEKQPPWYAAAGLPADAGAGVAKNALCSFLRVGPQVHGMPSLAFLICVSLKQGTSAAQP